MNLFYKSLIILVLLSICQLINGEIIVEEMHKAIGLYFMKLKVGNPPEVFEFVIDLQNEHNIVKNSQYSLLNSSSSENFGNSTSKSMKGLTLFRDQFEFLDNIGRSPQYFFFYTNENKEVLEPGLNLLGFSRSLGRFSIMYALKLQKLIEKYSFGFYDSGKENQKSYLFLGGLPEKFAKGRRGECLVKTNYLDWRCNLTQIMIQGIGFQYHFENDFEIVFQTNIKHIAAPTRVFYHIKDGIFEHYFKEGICMMNKYSGIREFNCDCNRISNFPNFTFSFEGFSTEFTREMLFEKAQEKCSFIIINMNRANEEWVFGTSFLSRFVTLFDYENNSITFYGDSIISKEKPSQNSSFSLIRALYCAEILLLLASIYVIITVKFKNIN